MSVPWGTTLNQCLDDLLVQANSHFRDLLHALTLYELGQRNLDGMSDAVAVSPRVGADLVVEPIPIREVRSFRARYPSFLCEIFHARLVQLWQDLLDRLFGVLLDLHIGGQRPFEEYGSCQASVDLRESAPIAEQVRESLLQRFAFGEYADRVRVVSRALDPSGAAAEELASIRKAVVLRNAFQHRGGVIDAYSLRKIGRGTISVLDAQGRPAHLGAGSAIQLSIPEVFAFRQSVLSAGQKWRSP